LSITLPANLAAGEHNDERTMGAAGAEIAPALRRYNYEKPKLSFQQSLLKVIKCKLTDYRIIKTREVNK
jgi:hypothetical protein